MRSFLAVLALTLCAVTASAQCPGDIEAMCGGDPNGCAEPLLIKLDDGPWKLAGLDDPVAFDINATGHTRLIGWTARDDVKTAFLALDRNGNGMIDDGSELFGNATPLPSGAHARNGFNALAQYDVNRDGFIDHEDPIWDSLLLWADVNHDGVSDRWELTRLSASAITSIELRSHWSGRHDPNGNAFAFQGQMHMGHQTRTIYDVFFVTETQNHGNP
jgi:hypothetical protein